MMNLELTCSLHDNNEFQSLREVWSTLLKKSDSNNIFLSWEWQHSWWKTWSDLLELKLFLLICKNSEGNIVGIAPLYTFKGYIIRGSFSGNHIAFIGSSNNIGPTVRSEYLDFIVDKAIASDVRKCLITFIGKDRSWDVFSIADMNSNSPTLALLLEDNKFGIEAYRRIRYMDHGTKINTSDNSFLEYLAGLSKSTRAAIYHRRKKLGNVHQIDVVATEESTSKNFKVLNQFHQERWGKPCFDKEAVLFHQTLSSYNNDLKPEFMTVYLKNEPIAILYNINYCSNIYNMQLGFTSLDAKVSLGMLTLGYSLDKCFENDEINSFDFLVGKGKETHYKSHFKGDTYKLVTMDIIRNKKYKYIFQLYDLIFGKNNYEKLARFPI